MLPTAHFAPHPYFPMPPVHITLQLSVTPVIRLCIFPGLRLYLSPQPDPPKPGIITHSNGLTLETSFSCFPFKRKCPVVLTRGLHFHFPKRRCHLAIFRLDVSPPYSLEEILRSSPWSAVSDSSQCSYIFFSNVTYQSFSLFPSPF